MSAPAFFARQGAARDEGGDGKDIAGLASGARSLQGVGLGEFLQAFDCCAEMFAFAKDGNLVPQNRPCFLDRLLEIRGWSGCSRRRCGWKG